MRSAHPTPLSKSAPPDDPEPDPARPAQHPPLSAAGALRKKGTSVRAWLLLDSTGQAQVVEAGKHAIMRRTGLPARDLRILDPLLSYPSTILGRERAIVINLEHIKAIITAQEVLLLNSRDPSVTPFVEELQRRLARHFHATTKAQEGNADDSRWTNLYDLEEPQSRAVSPGNSPVGFSQLEGQEEEEGEGKMNGKQALENREGLKVPPFEFVALEACLEAACSCLEIEAKTLEQEAHPALDKLTSKISTLNLERVRQIKSRLVAITGRVQKVRDELEHLLDDDEDMAEMYLTEKLVQQQLESSSASSINEKEGIDDEVLQSEMEDRVPAEISLDANGSSTYEGDMPNIVNPRDHLFRVLAELRERKRERDSGKVVSRELCGARLPTRIVKRGELWIPPSAGARAGSYALRLSDMEQACLWSTCDQSLLFSFGEVFDWRFLMLGDFLLVSFVNCT